MENIILRTVSYAWRIYRLACRILGRRRVRRLLILAVLVILILRYGNTIRMMLPV